MKNWLNPYDGTVWYRHEEAGLLPVDLLGVRARVECVTHSRGCLVHRPRWERRQGETVEDVVVTSFYRVHWEDCQLPAISPTERDWGCLWREMLGWLYSNDASRDVVLRAWGVFRRDKLSWMGDAKPFAEVAERLTKLFDARTEVDIVAIERRLLSATEVDVVPLPELAELGAARRIAWEHQDHPPPPSFERTHAVFQNVHVPLHGTWVIDSKNYERDLSALVEVEGVQAEGDLLLVAHVPQDTVTPTEVYVVGRDRHTKVPFALRVPAQFRRLEAALRWTVSAEPWDEVIEV